MTDFEILDGLDATDSEIDAFVALVCEGGAVEACYVRQGLKRKGAKLVFAKIDGMTVGVAALKVPSNEYRKGLEGKAKSGHPLPQYLYRFELGYVSVSSKHGGQGIGKDLVKQVLALGVGNGMFATTSHPAMMCKILPNLGFSIVGYPWMNDRQEGLHLMIIRAPKKLVVMGNCMRGPNRTFLG